MTGDRMEKLLTPQMHGVEEKGPHRVSNDELYRRSTQYRFWSFTNDEISDLRLTVNNKGQDLFTKRIENLGNDVDTDGLIKKYVADEFSRIGHDEELKIIMYYARKCKDLSNFFKFTTQVRLTAISYLLKFYLVHSIMEYYPQQIMYTCLFLSAKSENNFIGIKNFSKAIPKTTPEGILKYEYTILESMRFSLMCHHPMRPLYGFYLDIQNVLIKLDFNRLCKDYESCKSILNEAAFSDVQFLYSPPQIAMAALYIVDDVVCMRYLMRKFGVKRKQMLEQMNQRDKEKDIESVEPDLEAGVKKEDSVDASEEITATVTATATITATITTATTSTPPATATTTETETETATATETPMATSTAEPEQSDGDVGGDKNIRQLTPLEHYEKVMSMVKECAAKMQQKIDPSVEEAKTISLRAHFCLDPVKYFKKITKDTTPPAVSIKRELESTSEEDVKRVKIE